MMMTRMIVTCVDSYPMMIGKPKSRFQRQSILTYQRRRRSKGLGNSNDTADHNDDDETATRKPRRGKDEVHVSSV